MYSKEEKFDFPGDLYSGQMPNLQFEELAGKMESNIVRGLKDMHNLAKKHKIDNRRAAMALAVERVVEAFELKGIWP